MPLLPFDEWLKQQPGDVGDCRNLTEDRDCIEQGWPSYRWCLSCRRYARLVKQYNELEKTYETTPTKLEAQHHATEQHRRGDNAQTDGD